MAAAVAARPRFEPVLARAEALGAPLYLRPGLQPIVGHTGEGLATMLARFDKGFNTVPLFLALPVSPADRARIAHGNADLLLRLGGPAGG